MSDLASTAKLQQAIVTAMQTKLDSLTDKPTRFEAKQRNLEGWVSSLTGTAVSPPGRGLQMLSAQLDEPNQTESE